MKKRTVDISKYRDQIPPIPYGEFLVIGIFDIIGRFCLLNPKEAARVGINNKYNFYADLWYRRRFNGLHIETK